MLKSCSDCGREVSTEAKFCPHCGNTSPTSYSSGGKDEPLWTMALNWLWLSLFIGLAICLVLWIESAGSVSKETCREIMIWVITIPAIGVVTGVADAFFAGFSGNSYIDPGPDTDRASWWGWWFNINYFLFCMLPGIVMLTVAVIVAALPVIVSILVVLAVIAWLLF